VTIVDAHHHLGTCDHFLTDSKKSDVMKAMSNAKVDKFLLMPFPGSPDPIAEHNRIGKLADETSGRACGITAINPIKYGVKSALQEIDRTVKSMSFKCVKIHTIAWGLFPFNPIAEKIIERAQELKVPVMVHTGGSLFSSPIHVEGVARKYPDVTFVLAHMGWIMHAAEAINVAKNNSNVYVETSWSTGYDIKGAVETLGADRVMMGSDLPTNIATEVTKIRSLGLTKLEERKVLGETAQRVFRL